MIYLLMWIIDAIRTLYLISVHSLVWGLVLKTDTKIQKKRRNLRTSEQKS